MPSAGMIQISNLNQNDWQLQLYIKSKSKLLNEYLGQIKLLNEYLREIKTFEGIFKRNQNCWMNIADESKRIWTNISDKSNFLNEYLRQI